MLHAGSYRLRVRLVEAHTRVALTAWAARDFTVVHCRFTLSGAALHGATVGQVSAAEATPTVRRILGAGERMGEGASCEGASCEGAWARAQVARPSGCSLHLVDAPCCIAPPGQPSHDC